MAIIQAESGKLFTEQDIDGLTTRLQLKKLLAPYENFKKARGYFLYNTLSSKIDRI